jgi:hypothetical protein
MRLQRSPPHEELEVIDAWGLMEGLEEGMPISNQAKKSPKPLALALSTWSEAWRAYAVPSSKALESADSTISAAPSHFAATSHPSLSSALSSSGLTGTSSIPTPSPRSLAPIAPIATMANGAPLVGPP